MPFSIKNLEIPQIILIQPDVFKDERGFLSEIFKSSDFKAFGGGKPVVQVNYVESKKNVIRGLHYQMSPRAQAKFIKVASGSIFDIAVDIRKGSPSYGKWIGQTLSSDKGEILYIPEGFAHGFCSLSDPSLIIYFCTEEYSPRHERGVIWNDPSIAVKWPVDKPILSAKDAELPLL